MAPSDQPTQNQTSDSRPRDKRGRRLIVRLWFEWRLEIFIVFIIAFAVFLLVEQMQIRQALFGWLRQGFRTLQSTGGNIVQGMIGFVRQTTLSDLTAYVLLLGVFIMVAWRLRWRLMTMPHFTARACPQCGSELSRVHRRFIDRLISAYVPVARYRCRNSDCQWHGLRAKRARHE